MLYTANTPQNVIGEDIILMSVSMSVSIVEEGDGVVGVPFGFVDGSFWWAWFAIILLVDVATDSDDDEV